MPCVRPDVVLIDSLITGGPSKAGMGLRLRIDSTQYVRHRTCSEICCFEHENTRSVWGCDETSVEMDPTVQPNRTRSVAASSS